MGRSLAKLTCLGYKCDFSDPTPVTYSQWALVEMCISPAARAARCLRSEHRTLVPPNEPNMTTTTDILIIEDDAIMREALADWLQAAGYRVRKAADGSAGLAAVKLAAPALVVSDIHMPGASGTVVIAELRRACPEIPIIAISCLFNSGHGMDADAVIALGAARTLAKPFKRGDLLRAVADLLGASS
jgi:CheY-like chemotaxis protein